MSLELDQSKVNDADVNKDLDIANKAGLQYENGNFDEALKCLNLLGEGRAVENNRLVSLFAIEKDAENFLNNYVYSEELDIDQQVLMDYNRALTLVKYKQNYEDSINILENRLAAISEPFGLIDERLMAMLCYLLAIIYIEKKKDPARALHLLQTAIGKCHANALPPRVQQLKAKCYLEMGSTKSAKRELKSISGEPLLRTYLELQRCNLKKAIKIFSSCPESDMIQFNNDAVMQFSIGKKNSAVFTLNKKFNQLQPEMLYNLALMNLFTGNINNAYELFQKLVPIYSKNPRLWLHLAECVLLKVNLISKNDFELHKRKQDILNGYTGQGSYRKMILKGTNNSIKERESLLLAKGCLLNGLTLMRSQNDVNTYPSNPLTEDEFRRLKISILINLSYVNISLHDYVISYRFSIDAIKLKPMGYQKVLSHLYAGESCLWLDEISEAITHFSPTNINLEHPVQTDNENASNLEVGVPWFPQTAKIFLFYNLAVSHTLRGELNKASETLRHVGSSLSNTTDVVVPVQVIMLAIYIQLQQGYVDLAKSIVKQHLPQYR